MARRVEAVVIGAGLGGLSAAVSLARSGMSVLVLERHNLPGGYATSFVRGRFELEVALHELSGIGTAARPGPLRRYLDELGLLRRLELSHTTTLYRAVGPGLDFTLPPGWAPAEDALCQAFPDDAKGVRAFLRVLRRLAAEVAFVSGQLDRALSPALLVQLPFRCPTLLRFALSAYGPVLRRYVRGARARAALSQLWGYFGLPPDRCSFLYFALGLASYIEHGAAYLHGRSQSLSNAFVDALEGFGGELRLGCGVQRILAGGGRVRGVLADDGELIETGIVVSNADPVSTLGELLAGEAPRRALARLERPSLSVSTLNVYLGLARTAAELGITDHEVFINRDLDWEGHFRSTDALEPPGEITLTCYNHVLPDASPPGTAMVVLTALSRGRAWHAVRPADYVDTKHRLADAMLRLAEQVVPDLRSAVEVIEVSTPITNMRYTGALGGCIYGFANAPTTHSIFRLPHRSAVPGLYFAGAWTQPGGGFEPVIESGRLAARAVTRDLARQRGPARLLLPASAAPARQAVAR
jgi:phytoene dehydrogenase-like protein